MTPEHKLTAIIETANQAIETGNRLRLSHGIAFTLPTLFITKADQQDILNLAMSKSNGQLSLQSMTHHSITFRIIY